MKRPESYWAYKSPPIPEVKDLPPGVFKGSEHEWSQLSPGMRRTIWWEAVKVVDPETGYASAPPPSPSV